MTVPARIYEAKVLEQVSALFTGISEVFKDFEEDLVPSREKPLYVWATEIVIRHKDGYTIGRIGMDDFLFFEITDENYGDPNAIKAKVDDRDFPATEFVRTP
mgnify:FL=1